MARTPRKLNGHRWRRLTGRLRRERSVCEMPTCLCPAGRWIDPRRRAPDPWSFSADHIEPVARRPDLEYRYENLRAAHRRCNNSAQPNRKEPSRAW